MTGDWEGHAGRLRRLDAIVERCRELGNARPSHIEMARNEFGALVGEYQAVVAELEQMRAERAAAVACPWCNHHADPARNCQCPYWCGFVDCWRNGDPGTPDAQNTEETT